MSSTLSVVATYASGPLVINNRLGTSNMNNIESEHAASGCRFELQNCDKRSLLGVKSRVRRKNSGSHVITDSRLHDTDTSSQTRWIERIERGQPRAPSNVLGNGVTSQYDTCRGLSRLQHDRSPLQPPIHNYHGLSATAKRRGG